MLFGLYTNLNDQNPFAHRRRPMNHGVPWMVLQSAPGVTAMVDDVVVGHEDPVREPVVAHGVQRFSTGLSSGDFDGNGRMMMFSGSTSSILH